MEDEVNFEFEWIFPADEILIKKYSVSHNLNIMESPEEYESFIKKNKKSFLERLGWIKAIQNGLKE